MAEDISRMQIVSYSHALAIEISQGKCLNEIVNELKLFHSKKFAELVERRLLLIANCKC